MKSAVLICLTDSLQLPRDGGCSPANQILGEDTRMNTFEEEELMSLIIFTRLVA